MMQKQAERQCATCAYHDDYTCVCFNGESEHRADFTMNNQTCPCWQKEQKAKQNAESRRSRRKQS